jgi:uncharacterized protein (TIGR00255 family)
MTGFGEARHEGDSLSLLVELRAVNNKHLKVTVRGPDPYPLLEAEVEKILRKTIRRGTVQVHVRISRYDSKIEHRLNGNLLIAYLRQIDSILKETNLEQYQSALISGVLQLPGVAEDESLGGHPSESEWQLFETVLNRAVESLQKMRLEEGRSMGTELHKLGDVICKQLNSIRDQSPRVVELFRTRLRERITVALRAENVVVGDENLIREVAQFADRCDITEEIARLDGHLRQFYEILGEGGVDSPGRKLEFLSQEMGREANTIGSKASDIAISRSVVEIKGTLEKIKELIANVE